MPLNVVLVPQRQSPKGMALTWSSMDGVSAYQIFIGQKRLTPEELEAAALLGGTDECVIAKVGSEVLSIVDDVTPQGEARYYGVAMIFDDGAVKAARFKAIPDGGAEDAFHLSSVQKKGAAAAAKPASAPRTPTASTARVAPAPVAGTRPVAPPPASAAAAEDPMEARKRAQREARERAAGAAPAPAAEAPPPAVAPAAAAAEEDPMEARKRAQAAARERNAAAAAPAPAAEKPAAPASSEEDPMEARKRAQAAARAARSEGGEAAPAAASAASAEPPPPPSSVPLEEPVDMRMSGATQTWDGLRIYWEREGRAAAYEVIASDHQIFGDELADALAGKADFTTAVAVAPSVTCVIDNTTPRDSRGWYAVLVRYRDGRRAAHAFKLGDAAESGKTSAPFLNPNRTSELRAEVEGLLADAREQWERWKSDQDGGARREAKRIVGDALLMWPDYPAAKKLQAEMT